jgi:response regulator RpfG family c-di-GMP phosphodiesterase
MYNEFDHIPKRIMVIDDDPFSLMLSKMKLRKVVEERNIIDFYDTDNALEYLDQHLGKQSAMIPDMILLEVMMNDAKGWDFIPRFSDLMTKYNSSDIQLVVLTSSQFFSDYRKASKFEEVKGFMMKPIRNEVLLEIYGNAKKGETYAGNALFQSFLV